MSISDKRIYLASRSPRRRDLLKQIGVPFELLLLREDLRRGADVDETPLSDESPGVYVLRVAGAKVTAAARQIAYRGLPQKPVLAADTTVVFDDRIIGKPLNAGDATRMLRALSGSRHEVLTGVCVRRTSGALGVELEAVVSTAVRFLPLSAAQVDWYVGTGEPLDKAGAYALQGKGGVLVAGVEGSVSNVVGLPLAETAELLRRAGLRLPWDGP